MTEHYIQLAPGERGVPAAVINANPYLPIYDARGSILNCHARDYARRLRRAQNEVQAAIGAIERKPTPSPRPSTDVAPENASNDAVVGSWIYSLVYYLVCYPVGHGIFTLTIRILVFDVPEDMPLLEVAFAQWQLFGFGLSYAGLPGFYAYRCIQGLYTRLMGRTIDALPQAPRTLRWRRKLEVMV